MKPTLALIAVLGLALTGWTQEQSGGLLPSPMDVIVHTTERRVDWRWSRVDDPPIFRALAQLAKWQGLNPDDYTKFRAANSFDQFSGAYSSLVQAGGSNLVLVVQTVRPMGIPGRSANQLLLLNLNGSVLDRLQVEINSRYGVIEPELLSSPLRDGTQIIIRFYGSAFGGRTNWWHNWHIVKHREAERTFKTEDRAGTGGPSEWNQLGLVRLAATQSGFVIIHPKLDGSQPDSAANQSPPVGSQTNRAPAGSGR
jgi:hypothetical protein